eukprot:1982090-Amphidinium_carterae.1
MNEGFNVENLHMVPRKAYWQYIRLGSFKGLPWKPLKQIHWKTPLEPIVKLTSSTMKCWVDENVRLWTLNGMK